MPNDNEQTTVRFFKIAPGENARNWRKYRDGRYIRIGWDKVGDLRLVHSLEELKNRLEEMYPDKYRTAGRASKAANQLWMFKKVQHGDKVVANKGISKVLAIGTVTKGYEWRPLEGHSKFRHILEVDWDPIFDKPTPIDRQKEWNQNTVAPAKPELYKDLTGDRLPKRTTEHEADVALPDEVAPGEAYMEGAVKDIQLTRYERDPKARRECLNHYGLKCAVCGFDFERTYGKHLSGFIHVHHLRKLADIGREYKVDPVADLRPVCPNCHAVIHIRKEPYRIEEVRAMIHRSAK